MTERDLPLTPDDEALVVSAAARAPSVLNTQPWRFAFRRRRLEVWVDPSRSLPVSDPDRRFAVISCGAATYNAAVAIRTLGHDTWMQVLPRHGDPRLVATVHVGRPRPPAADVRAQYDAIARRRTNRGPYEDERLSYSLIACLEDAATTEGAFLRVLTSAEEERLQRILVDAAETQQDDPRFEAELARWVGTGQAGAGIPVESLGPLPAEDRTDYRCEDRIVTRDLDPAGRLGARGIATFERRPTLAVLSTWGDDRADWVRAGLALEHVLLVAAADGLAASFLNAPVELAEHRWLIRDAAAGLGWPQVVLRLGYPKVEVPETPRRPVR